MYYMYGIERRKKKAGFKTSMTQLLVPGAWNTVATVYNVKYINVPSVSSAGDKAMISLTHNNLNIKAS